MRSQEAEKYRYTAHVCLAQLTAHTEDSFNVMNTVNSIIAAAVAEANAELDHQIRKGFDAIDTKHDCTEWQSFAAKWEERCLYAEKVLDDHEITIAVPTNKSAMACSTIAPVRCVRQSASATAPETAQTGEALEPVTEINALLKENSELREVCDVQRETISKIQEQFGQEGRIFHLHHLVSVLKKDRDDLKKERDRLRAENIFMRSNLNSIRQKTIVTDSAPWAATVPHPVPGGKPFEFPKNPDGSPILPKGL